MKLEELRVYQMAMDLGEEVWGIVIRWNYFLNDTVGKQLLWADETVAANLSEEFGRYHFKEAKNFSYYSHGSLFETKTWIAKAYSRKLISKLHHQDFIAKIDIIGIKLNNYINSIGINPNTQ